MTVMCNEGELLERFGIELIPFNLSEIVVKVNKLIKNPGKDFIETLEEIRNKLKFKLMMYPLKRLSRSKKY